MTTSNYMPDVKVEIAFNAGYSTADVDRVWTDVSDYVELQDKITIGYGRQDEQAAASANKLTLTLDNRDGRFTPERSASPYYPNVKIGRPIRVTATPVGGTPSVRFVGYIDDWPVEWPGTDTTATSRITAYSRIARLGRGTEMKNLTLVRYLDAEPLQLFPLLGDRIGTVIYNDAPTILNYAGSGAPLNITGGLSPLGESTCAQFACQWGSIGQRLEGVVGATVTGPLIVAECWVAITTDDPEIQGFMLELRSDSWTGYGGLAGIYIGIAGEASEINSAYVQVIWDDVFAGGAATVDGADEIFDGEPHHVAAVLDESLGKVRLYIDGALQGQASHTAPAFSGTTVKIGADVTAGISFVMISDDEAGIGGRVGIAPQPASDWIEEFALAVGVPAAEMDLATGTTTVEAFETDNKASIDAMRVAEETEGGQLFDAQDNTLTFQARSHRYDATIALTLDASEQELEDGILPKLDRTGLVNEATATAADGSKAVAVNQSSIDEYGTSKDSISISSSYTDALMAASWRVYLNGEPRTRIPSLGVDLLPLDLTRQQALLALAMSDRIKLAGMPSQAAQTDIEFFVEGYSETIGLETYQFDFNVSSASGYDVWTIEDPVNGQYDAYPLAY